MRFSLYYETAQYTTTQQHRDSMEVWFSHIEDSLTLKHIVVLSYCDDVGSDFYNDSLSTNRARHTWQALKGFSFGNTTIMWIQGMGEVVLNLRQDEETQRRMNRRTDIWVYYEKGKKEEELKLTDLNVGEKLAFSNILFVPGTRKFLPESSTALDSLYGILRDNPGMKIAIIGHVCCLPVNTDGPDIETGEENLSKVRAKAVYDYLIKRGIDPTRLSHRGVGSQPTGLGDKLDRRVEIEITGRP